MRLSTLGRSLRLAAFAFLSLTAVPSMAQTTGHDDPPTFDDGNPDALPSVSRGTPGTPVVLQGVFSDPIASITFNGTPGLIGTRTMGAVNTVRVTVPFGATTGPIIISYTGGVTQSAGIFVVTGIYSFSPSSGPVGTKVRIRGRGLSGANVVMFGNASASEWAVSGDSLLSVIVPNQAAGSSRITILADSAQHMYQSQAYFPVTPAYSSISLLDPGVGRVNDTVRILGRGLTGALAVRFNGARALWFAAQSDTVLRAVVPLGATTGPVAVQGRVNTVTSSVPMVLAAQAKINSITPAGGPVGATVRLHGRGFTNSTAVMFTGAAATQTFLSGDSLLTVIVPQGAVTGKVTVSENNVSQPSQGSFVVYPRPFLTVTSVSANTGLPGDVLTLNGRYFTGTRYVRWNGVTSFGFTVASDSMLMVTVPGGVSSGPLVVYGAFNTSSPIAFTLAPGRLGVDDIVLSSQVEVFPNPSRGDFTLRLQTANVAQTYQLAAHAADGRLVLNHSFSGAQLSEGVKLATLLPAGLYTMTVTSGEATQRLRLQVTK